MDREPPQPPPGPPDPGPPDPGPPDPGSPDPGSPDPGSPDPAGSGGAGPEGPGWPLRGVTPDWADDAEWERMCAAGGDEPGPPDPDEEFFTDPDHGAPAEWQYVPAETAAARAREYAALRARLIAAGLDGAAHRRGDPPVPGIAAGPAAEFGQGCPLDAAAPSTVVCGLADQASGDDRGFAGVSDDQLMGLIGARQRLAGRQQWELLTGVAEFIRRRPGPGCGPDQPGAMPAVWDEHAAADLAVQLHLTRGAADGLLGLAHDLTVKLPLTSAALRDGIIDPDKTRTIAWYCFPLTPAEARAAEAIVFGLDTVEEMTWGMIRDRIARAVIEVNPDAARKRREAAARQKRVEVLAEQSGNCQIAGRELPAAAALAANENLTARARQLRAAGVPGGLDELRALAYLEKLGAGNPLEHAANADGADGGAGPDHGTGTDPGGTGSGPDAGPDDGPGNGGDGGRGPGGPGPGPGGPAQPGGGGGAAAGPGRAGLAARVNLTVPLATLLALAERPGVMSRIGPVDPALARDLAAAAARDPRSTWCITITGPDHRPLAHGCGRPPPRREPPRHDPRPGRDTDARSARDGPVYTPGDDHDPPGSGTIRLNPAALTGTTTGPGPRPGAGAARDLVFALETLAGPCDHAHQAAGHDPGTRLRHLTGILNASCTFPPCRRPEAQSDYEHSTPYEQGGRTCLCQAGPVCRRNHRDKQAPGWHLQHAGTRGWFRWTTPSGRSYLSRPTQYPD